MAVVWVNPGLKLKGEQAQNPEEPVLPQVAKLADPSHIPNIKGFWKCLAKKQLLVKPPGIVDRPVASTQDVESAGLVGNDRGYYSPGPGARTRSAAREAREKLTQYFQSKTRRKLSKQEKRCEILWDVAIAHELVKKQLFGVGGPDCDTDEEDVDPRLHLPEEEEILFKKHVAEQVDNLKSGLSDKVVQIVETVPVTDFYAEIRYLEAGETQGQELSPEDCEQRSVTLGGWSGSSPDFVVLEEDDLSEPSDNGAFEHVEHDRPVLPIQETPLDILAMDAQVLAQLTQAITGRPCKGSRVD